jgi:hypothetical protein
MIITRNIERCACTETVSLILIALIQKLRAVDAYVPGRKLYTYARRAKEYAIKSPDSHKSIDLQTVGDDTGHEYLHSQSEKDDEQIELWGSSKNLA